MTRSRDVSAVQNNLGVAIPPAAAGKNAVINGGMDIWQRGTSISLAASTAAASGFLADRWQCYTNANQACTISRQATGDTTNLPNIQYALRFQRNSGQTGTSAIPVIQNIESTNSIPYAGRTVTLSFYARAGANFSAASSQLAVYLVTGTGTDQNNIVGAGYTSGTNIVSSTATLTTTWQRFTYTATVGTTATQLGVQWNYTPSGTAGAADYFEITGVQLELGSSATPFSRNGSSIQGELAACQRYYFRTTADLAYARLSQFANATATTTVTVFLQAPIQMRTTPTAIEYSANLMMNDGFNNYNVSSMTLNTQSNKNFVGLDITAATGMTQYRAYQLVANNSTTAYVAATAEL